MFNIVGEKLFSSALMKRHEAKSELVRSARYHKICLPSSKRARARAKACALSEIIGINLCLLKPLFPLHHYQSTNESVDEEIFHSPEH